MKNKKEQILIKISGQDRTGLTASVMEILARYDADILDMGQADIHATLSLGILIRIDEKHSGQVMKELLFKATELGVNIGFEPVPDDEYERWAGQQGKHRYILTVLGRSLSAAQIQAAAAVVADSAYKKKIAQDVQSMREFAKNEQTFRMLALRRGGVSVLGLIASYMVVNLVLNMIILYQ